MKIFFYPLLFSFFLLSLLQTFEANAAPPEEWHHQKTNLTSLKSGWASNRHYTLDYTDSHMKTDGCGLVQFELPPLFSTSSFDRHKIKIALSLTTYLPGDFIHPSTNLEISSINPEWQISRGETIQMTVHSGTYTENFSMTAQPPNVWIATISQQSLSDMLIAFSKNKEGEIHFSSGEIMPLKFGHIKSTLENFRACLSTTKFADLPPFQENNETNHFF